MFPKWLFSVTMFYKEYKNLQNTLQLLTFFHSTKMRVLVVRKILSVNINLLIITIISVNNNLIRVFCCFHFSFKVQTETKIFGIFCPSCTESCKRRRSRSSFRLVWRCSTMAVKVSRFSENIATIFSVSFAEIEQLNHGIAWPCIQWPPLPDFTLHGNNFQYFYSYRDIKICYLNLV